MFFQVAHQEHSSIEQHSATALRYSRYWLATRFFTRSLRRTKSARDLGLQQQGKALYPALLLCALLFSALLCSTLLYSTVLHSTLFYPALLYFFTLLYSTPRCSTLLYPAVLHSALSCPALLYFTLPYATLRYWPLCSSPLDSALLLLLFPSLL